jgi:hypothetical protein
MITAQNLAAKKWQRLIFGGLPKVRVPLVLATGLYAFSLIYFLAVYASTEWSNYGFTYAGLNATDFIFLIATILFWSVVLPTQLDRPSSLFLFFIYVLVCFPAVILMLTLDRPTKGMYYPLLSVFVLSFGITCYFVRRFRWSEGIRCFSSKFVSSLVMFWTLLLIFLIYKFNAIMSFSALDLIYDQREAGAAKNLLEGYAQTYFGYVASTTLVAIGFFYKKKKLIVLGSVGAVVLYMIAAEKAIFMYPFFIAIIYWTLVVKTAFFRQFSFLLLCFSLLIVLPLPFIDKSAAAAFFAWYVGIRSILLPGGVVVYYFDFFSANGYTLLSHVTGFGLLIDAPRIYSSDPKWPSIGYLIGDRYFGLPAMNANANFIASDGVASFGIAGVFFAFAVFAGFLVVLDRVTRGMPLSLSLPPLVPLALTLTNGSIFTSLTSFGGIFLILCFGFFGRKN